MALNQRWDARLEELLEFKRGNGHCDVPKRHPGGLGQWVSDQRKARRQRKRCLNASRIRKLENEGFRWEVHDERWDARLKELREFKRQNGHCDVPQRYPGGLGNWVYNQRRARKDGTKCLDATRIQKLEDEGFRWAGCDKVVCKKRWDTRLEELREFKRKNGHCNVPQRHPGGLGMWVSRQRADRSQGESRLDSCRIQKLDNEGFKWKARGGRGGGGVTASGGLDDHEEDGRTTKRDKGAITGDSYEAGQFSIENEGEPHEEPAEEPKASRGDFRERESSAEGCQRETEGSLSETVPARTLQGAYALMEFSTGGPGNAH